MTNLLSIKFDITRASLNEWQRSIEVLNSFFFFFDLLNISSTSRRRRWVEDLRRREQKWERNRKHAMSSLPTKPRDDKEEQCQITADLILIIGLKVEDTSAHVGERGRRVEGVELGLINDRIYWRNFLFFCRNINFKVGKFLIELNCASLPLSILPPPPTLSITCRQIFRQSLAAITSFTRERKTMKAKLFCKSRVCSFVCLCSRRALLFSRSTTTAARENNRLINTIDLRITSEHKGCHEFKHEARDLMWKKIDDTNESDVILPRSDGVEWLPII